MALGNFINRTLMYIKIAEMVTKIAATFKISKMNPCEKLRMNLEQKQWEGQWNIEVKIQSYIYDSNY